LGFQRSKGRASSSGRRLVLSKGSNANRNVYCCMGSLNLLFVAALVVEYRRTPRGSGGVRALLCTALGCWLYFPTTTTMVFLGYHRIATAWTFVGNSLSQYFFNWGWSAPLMRFAPHSRICLLTAAAGAQFVRAAGSSAIILSTTFFNSWALLLLPSSKFKVFHPSQTLCSPGCVRYDAIAVNLRPRAGAQRNAGISPRVRGTVKNANDHPNGGRSRSLRCSKTPWGYVAKKSRRPN